MRLIEMFGQIDATLHIQNEIELAIVSDAIWGIDDQAVRGPLLRRIEASNAFPRQIRLNPSQAEKLKREIEMWNNNPMTDDDEQIAAGKRLALELR